MGLPQCTLLPAARLIQHTQDLVESEEKLCVKVLRTLQQMLLKKAKYGDRVSARWPTPGCRGQGCRASGSKARSTLWGLAPSLQGNQLRKMLLQNYLQHRKSSSRGDLPDPMGIGQYRLLCSASGWPVCPALGPPTH